MSRKRMLTALVLGFTLLGTSARAIEVHPSSAVVFAGIPIGASQSTVSDTLSKRSPRPVLIANTPI